MENQSQVLRSYQLSSSPREIIDSLTRGHVPDKCMMWQSKVDHKKIFNFQTFELDLSNRTIKVAYDGSKDQVDLHQPVYFKLGFREMVFKGKIAEAKSNQIRLHIPDEIHMREFREGLRSTFKIGEKVAYLRPGMASVDEVKIIILKVPLRNVTQMGLGLLVAEKNARHFKRGQLVELMGFDQINLRRPILGKVVYAIPEKGLSSESGVWHRVGVQMFNPIPDEAFKELSQPPKAPRNPRKELLSSDVFSTEFKKMMEAEVSKTVGKMKQRPAILKYLNQLEIARGQDEYLEEHIQMLTVICTFIARSMSWVSEASLEKFIYASYLHDAPFFAHPKLARIRNLTEFDLIKDELTQEERSIYLGAPEIAAAIALADHQAPMDAAQMLITQKELPNGDGFPNRWTFSKLSPMSALFIVAHSLTDEVMTNEDWSVDAWLKDAKKIYRGGHYNKIMEAIETVKVTLKRVKA